MRRMVSPKLSSLWWKRTPRPSCTPPPRLGERRSNSLKGIGAALEAGPRRVREHGEEAYPDAALAREDDQDPLQAAVAPDRVSHERRGDDAEGEQAGAGDREERE